ncbi:hypothetical protein ACFCV9_36400 [Streptomyces sp. NPDC056367]|uniref:hypothetical protein n=1 Tax=Streptomyces sp. NPDC056367 TaxID=3345797 RepID=UPI0035DA4EDE
MKKNQLGQLIGGLFGLAFIQANAGALPQALSAPIRVAAVAAFLGLFLSIRRSSTGTAPRAGFGRTYWYVVAAEVIAALGGAAVITNVLDTPRATVGWIALVVGVHFFGLAAVWRMHALRVLAAAMSVCGAAGMALAFGGASAATVAAVAGVAPGALLLAAAWRGDSRPAAAV